MGNSESLHLHPPRMFVTRTVPLFGLRSGLYSQWLMKDFLLPVSNDTTVDPNVQPPVGSVHLFDRSFHEKGNLMVDVEAVLDVAEKGKLGVDLMLDVARREGIAATAHFNSNAEKFEIGASIPTPAQFKHMASINQDKELFLCSTYIFEEPAPATPESQTLEIEKQRAQRIADLQNHDGSMRLQAKKGTVGKAVANSGPSTTISTGSSNAVGAHSGPQPYQDLTPQPIESIHLRRGSDFRKTQLSMYGRMIPAAHEMPVFGIYAARAADPYFVDVNVEFDTAVNRVTKADIGVSFTEIDEDAHSSNNLFEPNFEFGLRIQDLHCDKNRRLVASYYRHMVVPRRVMVALNSSYKLINNYIDYGIEMSFKLGSPGSNSVIGSAAARRQNLPVDASLACAWQINKNNLVKMKLSRDAVQTSYTMKTWTRPRLSAMFVGRVAFPTMEPSLGVHLGIDSDISTYHGSTTTAYSDTVGMTMAAAVHEKDRAYV